MVQALWHRPGATLARPASPDPCMAAAAQDARWARRATRREVQRHGPVVAESLGLGVGTKLKREWQGEVEEALIER